MYTSGTTAEPKGVLHTHDTLHYELLSLGLYSLLSSAAARKSMSTDLPGAGC